MRLLGLLLNVAGVLALWFGGIPYRQRETVVDLGVLGKLDTEREKRVEIPAPVGAGLVGVGSALLLAASFKPARKRD